MLRVQAVWAGFQGAPGYSNFFMDTPGADSVPPAGVDGAVTSVVNFFAAIKGSLSPTTSVSVSPVVEFLNATSGIVVGEASSSATPPAQVGTATATTLSAASGACVSWGTSTIVGRRRVRGRTFVVPLSIEAYDSTGTLAPDTLTRLTDGSRALIGATAGNGTRLVIWHRPKIGAGGVQAFVTSAAIRDRVAVLRSRRD